MNKKIKIFYIVDLIFMIISVIGIIIVNNKTAYGLEALANVGYVVVLLFMFIVSLILLIAVSLIYVILKRKHKKEENTICKKDKKMINIKFIKKENRAVAYDDDIEIGECVFKELEDTWNIIHTVVNTKYQGQGIAKTLVKCVIENSKECNKNLIAECSYAKKVLEIDNI